MTMGRTFTMPVLNNSNQEMIAEIQIKFLRNNKLPVIILSLSKVKKTNQIG